jgi:hypothetical protein
MSKSERTQYGGVLGMLDTLLYDVFSAMAARMYDANWGPSADRAAFAARRQPTAEVSRASYGVTMATRARADVVGRRPRTA